MKKTILLVIILSFFLILCNKMEQKGKDDAMENFKNIIFEEGVYKDKEWNEKIFVYKDNIIPNEKVAINIANAYYKEISKNFKNEKRSIQNVFFDIQDEIWIVSFCNNQKHGNSIEIGSECNIAMKKATGEIVKIWFEE